MSVLAKDYTRYHLGCRTDFKSGGKTLAFKLLIQRINVVWIPDKLLRRYQMSEASFIFFRAVKNGAIVKIRPFLILNESLLIEIWCSRIINIPKH
jgi:hypothetical protein